MRLRSCCQGFSNLQTPLIFLPLLHIRKTRTYLTITPGELHLVPTDCIIRWALVTLCLCLSVCIGPKLCVFCGCVCVEGWPVGQSDIIFPCHSPAEPRSAESKSQWCHPFASPSLSQPVCCGASNQTNVQRLGQLNCRNTCRLHDLSGQLRLTEN